MFDIEVISSIEKGIKITRYYLSYSDDEIDTRITEIDEDSAYFLSKWFSEVD